MMTALERIKKTSESFGPDLTRVHKLLLPVIEQQEKFSGNLVIISILESIRTFS